VVDKIYVCGKGGYINHGYSDKYWLFPSEYHYSMELIIELCIGVKPLQTNEVDERSAQEKIKVSVNSIQTSHR